MAILTAVIFSALLLCSLAIPVPDENAHMSVYFENVFVENLLTFNGRIVGGTVAPAGSHPWMVAFTTGGASRNAHCGGSLISDKTVLTAAHCIVPVRFGNAISASVRLNVGTNVRTSGGQSLTASGCFVHENYNPNIIKNDVGLVFIAGRITFNNFVAPITLSFSRAEDVSHARVAGFGRTSSSTAASNQLLEVILPVRTPEECRLMIGSFIDTELEICTFLAAGSGACNGDSGSALVRLDNRQQIGIVSWGYAPCASGRPEVFARVSSYESWINKHIRR